VRSGRGFSCLELKVAEGERKRSVRSYQLPDGERDETRSGGEDKERRKEGLARGGGAKESALSVNRSRTGGEKVDFLPGRASKGTSFQGSGS